MHVEGLQRLAARGWPGLEVAALGEWELHAGAGFTGRANACLPSGDPGLPPAQAVRAVEAWYADRGIAPRFQVAYDLEGPEDPAPGIDSLLAADGWVADPTTMTMAADIAALPAPIDRGEVRVAWAPAPDSDWLALYHYRGAPLPKVALRVITAAPAHYLSLIADGRLIGIGRAVVTDDWVGLSASFSAVALATVRRRGWAQSVAEREAGVASVSAPVRSPSGKVIAAVSVSGPIERLSRQPGRLHAPAVMAAAERLSEVLRRTGAEG